MPGAAGLVLCALGLLATRVEAHPEISPTLVNRYLAAAVLGDKIQLSLTLLFGLVPAAELRRKIDSDADGTISDSEIAAAQGQWRQDTQRTFAFSLDGKPAELVFAASVHLNGTTADSTAPAVIEIAASCAVTPGRHSLRLDGGHDLPRLGETEIALDLSPDWTLVESRGGAAPLARETLWKYRFDGPRRDPKEDRSVTFVIGSAQAGREPAGERRTILGLTALVVVVTTLVVRRRRNRGQ